MTKKQKTAKPNASKATCEKAIKQAMRNPALEPERSIITERFEWQGITVAVSYEADWLGMAERFPQFATAHLEIESVTPAKQPLPITETGYRSHFVARGVIDQAGGPLAYARTWLYEAAKNVSWKRRQEGSRQLSLF